LTHDVVLACAYAHELPRYGIKLGLTNYAAAYAVGLLLARRVNSKFNLKYEGNTDVNGEDFNVEEEAEGARPFKALLDVGLARTTTGAKVFGALKGATDGGILIPHNDRRFPGSKKEAGENAPAPDVHRKYIFGGHVSEYMKSLQEEDEERYNKQFKRYIDAGVGPDNIEGLFAAAHKAIRADPNKKRSPTEKGRFGTRAKAKTDKDAAPTKKRFTSSALSLEQRRARIRVKLLHRGHKPITVQPSVQKH